MDYHSNDLRVVFGARTGRIGQAERLVHPCGWSGLAAHEMRFTNAYAASPRGPGANDRINLGLIGPGHRSRDLLKESPTDLNLVAMSDGDLRQIDACEKWYFVGPEIRTNKAGQPVPKGLD